MTSKELYQYVKDLVDKNSTGSGADIPKQWFVDSYRINSIRYVEFLLNNRNDDVLRNISNLRTSDFLENVTKTDIFDEFKFPEDYLNFINISATLTSKKCPKGLQTQIMKEIKPENFDLMYNDPFNEPSIKHAETLYNTFGEGVIVYKKGFEIKDVTLYYYKKPLKIDIEGYIKDDDSQSVNVDPDLNDPALIEIALMIARQFTMASDDYNKNQGLTQTQQMKK